MTLPQGPLPAPRPVESATDQGKGTKQKKPKPPSFGEVERELARSHAELEQNLAALGEKLDVGKHARVLTARAKDSYEENPVPWWAAGAAAAVAAAGLIVWAVRRR